MAQPTVISESPSQQDTVPPAEQFKGRESKEFILAFSGPVGCGIEYVIDEAEFLLKDIGYDIKRVKLSNFIKLLCESIKEEKEFSFVDQRYERYGVLQDAGNFLREKFQYDILAESAIAHITLCRAAAHKEDIDKIVPGRTAYIIDQLKHPSEVELLRAVYGNLFYLVGVLCSQSERKRRLMDQNISEHDATFLMTRDQKEDFKHGQQLDKTLQLSDLFVRNNKGNATSLKRQLERFLFLVHGKHGITPSLAESGMYAAHTAALRSACLSRQVGAAITDEAGNLIATGCNDVPSAEGGLYSAEHKSDQRCVFLDGGKCFNDHHKLKLRDEIATILSEEGGAELDASKIADKLYLNTRLQDLLEFSRSVHAEMDALVSVARVGGMSVKDGVLFTTTFPCHNCARHIIAAGIKKVVFIEPYEKSLAIELHSDAIELDSDRDEVSGGKVDFVHFEGIAPNRFTQFFQMSSDRKDDDGKAVHVTVREAPKVSPQYLDKYFDLEAKVLQHLNDLEVDPKRFS